MIEVTDAEIDKAELEHVINIFEGWCEGFCHGAKLGSGHEPHIFVRVKGCLYNLQKIYRQTTSE